MKKILQFSYLCSFFIIPAIAPVYSQGLGDPFNWTEPIEVKSDDIFLLWQEDAGGQKKSYQKVYRFKVDSAWLPTDSLISKTTRKEDLREGGVFSDLTSGRFNKDPYDDVVSVWYNENGIEIMMPVFDTTQGMWSNTVQATIDIEINNRFFVRAADFDGDSLDEFVVAYVTADDSIRFEVYDVDSALSTSLIASFSDEKLEDAFDLRFNNYFIETADVNGDGKDELLLQAADDCLHCSDWSIYLKIYEVEGNQIIPKARRKIQPWQNNLNGLFGVNLAIVPGQFKDNGQEEIAFVCIFKNGESLSIDNEAYVYLLEVSPDLQQIMFDPAKRKYLYLTGISSQYNQLSLDAGDLNNNGRDEVVFNTGSKIYVYSTDDNLNLFARVIINVAEGGPSDFIQSYNFLKVADVNQDNREDIIIVKNFVANQFADGFFAAMITVNDPLTESLLIGRMFGDEPQSDSYQYYAITIGNFDGYNFTIGQPEHFTQPNVIQPIVLLNAPPVHFDVIDGIPYDINSCYNGGACDFYSKYIKTNLSSVEVTTKVTKDWGISAGLGGSGSIKAAPLGTGATFNYEAYLLFKHGRHFSNDTTNISTLSVGVEVLAKEDDKIYTTVTDYDLWEYPVFHGNEEFPRRSIMTLVPNNVRGQWFPSKSYAALSYIPDHEVGNILSYYPYDTLTNNPNVAQSIRANYVSDSFTLSSGTSYDWNLMFSDFTSSQADTSRRNGIDFKLSFIVMVQFDYTHTRMSTHKTSITEQINLHSHLGGVNLGIGDVKYTVTPYAYWAENDALIVDYAVKPELAPPGFPNTWWQDHYGGKSDPTFILPWKYDPEKGFALSEPAKRFQTKDIVFSTANPIPGDTLTITARVRNYSLIPTPSVVSVRFYFDDPDSGGVPIIGINGSNAANTNGVIKSQDRSDVEFKWVIPAGLPSFPRIYAIIDQGNAINEIHENNNKGFNVLGSPSITNVRYAGAEGTPKTFTLYQSYPNPFNPQTKISYALPNTAMVNLIVYDILGQEVATLVNEIKQAGTYEVIFNAAYLPSGIYLYRIQAGSFAEVKKMIFLK